MYRTASVETEREREGGKGRGRETDRDRDAHSLISAAILKCLATGLVYTLTPSNFGLCELIFTILEN